MEYPDMLKGDSLTRIIQGAVFGFIATAFIGFNYGGWTLEANAERLRRSKSRRPSYRRYPQTALKSFKRRLTPRKTWSS